MKQDIFQASIPVNEPIKGLVQVKRVTTSSHLYAHSFRLWAPEAEPLFSVTIFSKKYKQLCYQNLPLPYFVKEKPKLRTDLPETNPIQNNYVTQIVLHACISHI